MMKGFIGYLILINLAWTFALGNFMLTPKLGFLMPPLFYLYNAFMFSIVLALYQRDRDRVIHSRDASP